MIDLLSAIAALAQTAPAIKTGLQGKNLKKTKQLNSEIEGLANAQSNPDSAIYQKLYQQNREAGNQDLAATIAELSRQNRKQLSMGRSPLLNQERGGESVFRNLMLGQQDVGNQARTSTLNQLRGAQNSLQNVNENYGNIADEEYNNKLKKVGAYYTAGDTLKGLRGLFGLDNGQYSGSKTILPNNEVINWRR